MFARHRLLHLRQQEALYILCWVFLAFPFRFFMHKLKMCLKTCRCCFPAWLCILSPYKSCIFVTFTSSVSMMCSVQDTDSIGAMWLVCGLMKDLCTPPPPEQQQERPKQHGGNLLPLWPNSRQLTCNNMWVCVALFSWSAKWFKYLCDHEQQSHIIITHFGGNGLQRKRIIVNITSIDQN